VVICLERGADLHMAQLMPLSLTVSCFSKIQIGFAFLVPADLGSPGKKAVKRVFVCMYMGRKAEYCDTRLSCLSVREHVSGTRPIGVQSSTFLPVSYAPTSGCGQVLSRRCDYVTHRRLL